MHPRKQRRAEIEAERTAISHLVQWLETSLRNLREQDATLDAEYQVLRPLRGDARTLLRDLRDDPIAMSRVDAKRCYREGVPALYRRKFATTQSVGSGTRLCITQAGLEKLKLDEEEEKDTSP